MAGINQNNNYTTSDSIAVYLTGLDSSYNHQNFPRQARWYYRVFDSGEEYIGPLNKYGYYTGSDTYVEIDNGASQSALFNIMGQDINGTITSLQPNTAYDIKCTITYESNGTPVTSLPIVLEGATTKPLTPSFSFSYSISSNEISIGVIGSNYSGDGRVVITCNGNDPQVTYLNYRVTYSGLSPNTSYTFSATIDSTYTISKTLTTQSPSIIPFSFPDGYENGQNPVLQTGSAVNRFEYTVWNDMLDKVNEIFVNKGWSWDTYYDTFQNTKMTLNDRVLTAVRFNSLRNNLDLHPVGGNTTNIGVVVKDVTPVQASYFITLKNYINSLI